MGANCDQRAHKRSEHVRQNRPLRLLRPRVARAEALKAAQDLQAGVESHGAVGDQNEVDKELDNREYRAVVHPPQGSNVRIQ